MLDVLTRPATATWAAAPTRSIPITRLTLVELRKLTDTRAGLWLLISIGLATVATSLIMFGWSDDSEQTFAGFFQFGIFPSTVLLPVLGILSMTSEWSQRTALTTFTLTPARGRVIVAKLISGVLIALATTVLVAGWSAVANLIGADFGGDGGWQIDPSLFWQATILEVLYVVMGLGFGALLLNSPLAIVMYLALPNLWTVLGTQITSLQRAAGWLDVNITSGPLTTPDMAAHEYGRLGVSVALWILLPLVLGSMRVIRREIA